MAKDKVTLLKLYHAIGELILEHQDEPEFWNQEVIAYEDEDETILETYPDHTEICVFSMNTDD